MQISAKGFQPWGAACGKTTHATVQGPKALQTPKPKQLLPRYLLLASMSVPLFQNKY